MNSTSRLGLFAGIGLVVGCAAAPVPDAPPYQPTISGLVTKLGQPAVGRRVFLKKFEGHKDGYFENEVTGAVSEATTSEDGRYTLNVPLDQVLADGLFGVGYDPVPAEPTRRSQKTNTDEIRAFSTAAIWLHARPGVSAVVNFDLAWDTRNIKPTYGEIVFDKKVEFTIPPYANASTYDLTVVKGTLEHQGAEAFFARTKKDAPADFTWKAAGAGDYLWQARAYGRRDDEPFRVDAPAVNLSVAGSSAAPSASPTPTVSPSPKAPSPSPSPRASQSPG